MNRAAYRRRSFVAVTGVLAMALAAPASTVSAADGSAAAGRHLIVVEPGARAALAARVEAHGATLAPACEEIGIEVARGLSDAQASSIAGIDGVLAVERDRIVGEGLEEGPADELSSEGVAEASVLVSASPSTAEFYARQWNLRAIGAEVAWSRGYTGSSSVTAFVLDTGIDYRHPDLGIRRNADGTPGNGGLVDLQLSKSFVSTYSMEDSLVRTLFPGEHEVLDLHSHGTAIAGLIATQGRHLAGVTQQTTLVSVKVHDRTRTAPITNYLTGICYAANKGADVIHLSIPTGFSKREEPGLVAAISKTVSYAHSKGAVLVAAAGNADAVNPPVDFDRDGDRFRFCNAVHVICVSATGPSDRTRVQAPDWDESAAYTFFGRSAIDVAAPGGTGLPAAPIVPVWLVCSRATQAPGAQFASCKGAAAPDFDARRLIWRSTGTSFGAGATSGLAALLVSVVGRDRPAEIEALIKQSAEDLGEPGTDPKYGKGRISVQGAVEALGL
jgi:lantibiotic leader peptide-processing serine protease